MDINELLPGRAMQPGEEGFAEAAAAWNVAVGQDPLAVVRAADAKDVVALVRAAGEHGFVVGAQPGGHGATGAIDGCVLLRTGALDEIWIDAQAKVARVGAGVKWGDLLAALDGSGLIGLAGSNPDVSVVGYLLGGGMSWFGRRYGVAAHQLRAVELVDGTGAHRWVTDDSDPDLMWALRGGGGEFGIVTRVEIALQPEPELFGGKLTFDAAHSAQVLRTFRDLAATVDDATTMWTSIMHFPDLPALPEVLRGRSFCVVDLTVLGRQTGAVDALTGCAPLLSSTFGPVPIGRLGDVAAEPTDPTPALDWSTTLADLDDATIDRLLAAVADRGRTAVTSVQVRHLDGAFRLPGPGAFSHLGGPFAVYAFGIPASADAAASIRSSLAAVADAVASVDLHRTCPTLLGAGEPLAKVFDAETLRRLREVKRRVDPLGVIRGNRPL